MLTVTIAGTDRTSLIRMRELVIESKLTSEPDSARFTLVSTDASVTPAAGDEVIITNESATRVFGGLINAVSESGAGSARWHAVECVDYTVELDRRLIVEDYDNQTCAAIISDMITKINEYQSAGKLFTTTAVSTGPTIKKLRANYRPFSLMMEKLYQLSGYEWYCDYSRDVHFFPNETTAAPANLRAIADWTADGEWLNLVIRRGPLTQLRNRIIVRGATYEGSTRTFNWAGDGQQRVWPLPDLARTLEIRVDGVSKTIGNAEVDTTGYQWYHHYEGQWIRQDASETVLSSANVLSATYIPMIPLRVAVEDTASITTYGYREHLVQDAAIDTKEVARLRGQLEVRGVLISGSFNSLVSGWQAGQTFDISLSARSLTGRKGKVTRCTLRYAGNLNKYVTAVEFEVV